MSEAAEINDSNTLIEEIQQIGDHLNDLHLKIRHLIDQLSRRKGFYEDSSIHALLQTSTIIKSLCDDLMNNQSINQSINPSDNVNHIWYIIESYCTSSESVIEGVHLLEEYFKLKMHSIIQPTNYLNRIVAYLQSEYKTVRCFVDQYKLKPRTDRFNKIEPLWDGNHQEKESMFLGEAVRSFHFKTLIEF